jgi:hypothetical protein
MFNEYLENLIKAETQNKIVLNTKGTELTLKLSTYMVSPSRKLLFDAHSHQFLTQTSRKGLWQPRGIPGDENGGEKWEVGWPIYRESSPLMYKFIVLASTRVTCNMVVCNCKVEPIGSCVLESKFKPKIIMF